MNEPKVAADALAFARQVLELLSPDCVDVDAESPTGWKSLPGTDVDDYLMRAALAARLVVLRHELASRSGWAADEVMALGESFMRLKEMPNISRGLRELRSHRKAQRAGASDRRAGKCRPLGRKPKATDEQIDAAMKQLKEDHFEVAKALGMPWESIARRIQRRRQKAR